MSLGVTADGDGDSRKNFTDSFTVFGKEKTRRQILSTYKPPCEAVILITRQKPGWVKKKQQKDEILRPQC